MSLAPLLAAPAVIQVHAFAALGAFGLGALVIAGVFTFLPGRIMHAVVFGT